MTTVTQIIIDAYRQSNLLAITATPTDAQVDEALRYLNRLVKSVFGNEAGEPLEPFPIGNQNISRPAGYPWWNTVPSNDWFVPKNTRAMFNLNSVVSLYLHPAPDDGSRFAAIDIANSLATYPCTVYGNGNNIDGATSIVLDEDGFNAEWFYREDLANWQKYFPLGLFDDFPFPLEFDDFFVSMLSLRLNPSYATSMDPQAAETLRRSKSQIRARYTQDIPVRSELALIRTSKMAADRDQWGNSYWLYQPNAMFDKGWPW